MSETTQEHAGVTPGEAGGVIETRFGQVEIERVDDQTVGVSIDGLSQYEISAEDAVAIADRLKEVAGTIAAEEV